MSEKCYSNEAGPDRTKIIQTKRYDNVIIIRPARGLYA